MTTIVFALSLCLVEWLPFAYSLKIKAGKKIAFSGWYVESRTFPDA